MRLVPLLPVLLLILVLPAGAQEMKNPSLLIETVEIPHEEFNRVARDAPLTDLVQTHAVSWQVTLDNDILYGNPLGNAAMRLHDQGDTEKFIEVGMGSPPDRKFWIAVQIPGEEGYVVIHSKTERGWHPDTKTIISYTDRAGMTVNNGERIVVSNLDIEDFAIGSYSVFGMEGSTDPPAATSGVMTAEFLSGDPGKNALAFFPFYITAAVGVVVGILFITKRRPS